MAEDITLNTTESPIKLGDEQASSPFFKNLAEDLDEKTLSNIGATVVSDYEIDLASRSTWDSKIKQWYTLFVGLLDKKTFPWEDSSNINIPLLSTACLQFQARAFDALLPPKEIAKCFSTDGTSIDEAKRCQAFMNWQLTEQMEEWEEDMDMLLLSLPIFGSTTKKTHYDPVLERNVSRTLRVNEFVAPYGVKRLEDAPRVTHIYDMSLNDIRIKGDLFVNTEDILVPSSDSDRPASEYTEKSDEATGIAKDACSNDSRVLLEQHRLWDLDGDGIEEPYVVIVDKDTSKVLRIDTRLYKDPVTEKTKTFNYFTSYSFIPNPDSWMGFGFGHLLADLNHSANTLINQLTDSGTLANISGMSGLVNRRSNLGKGDIEAKLGQFNAVDLATDDIRKAIYTFDFNPPSQVLFVLLQLIQGYSRELSSVSESMLGKLPPSDTTATSMLAVMEQGLKVFSTIHKRVHRTFRKELRKIAALNAVYLDEKIYFAVQDSTSQEMKTLESGQKDFLNTIDVIPMSDPNITSRAEKLIKANQVYEFSLRNESMANDPIAMYEISKSVLVAMEVQNIDQILKRPEPQEPPDLRPEEEHAEFLREVGVQPLPEQDHVEHLESHRIFEASQWSQQLTPQGKKVLEAHIKETIALLYLQNIQTQGAINEALAGGAGGMVGQPGNEGGAVGTA